MATTITTSFLKQGTCGSTGNVHTCVRIGNSGVTTDCDIGGSGSGSSYRNGVLARFADVPAGISSATLTITYSQSGSDYWNADQTLSVKACANFTNSTTGENLPTTYGSAKTAELEGGTASIAITVTDQVKAALANGSKCLWITANAANNRKRVSAVKLSYVPINVVYNGQNVTGVVYNGTTLTGLKYNGTTIF